MPTCKTLLQALLGALYAILFASSLEGGGVMRNLAIRGAMMGALGGQKSVNWVDGEYYYQDGSIRSSASLSRMEDFIPVVGGHSITWKWGDKSATNCYLIVYNSDKQRIDHWAANSGTGERTITFNRTGMYLRYSIIQNFKDTTFLLDNTTGEYLIKDGKILI